MGIVEHGVVQRRQDALERGLLAHVQQTTLVMRWHSSRTIPGRVSQTAVCDRWAMTPSGARRRVSYPVSDSLSCKRRARGPVPCAARALHSNMSEVLGYGFFPTLMTIAFLPCSWSVRVGWQGIPATVRALLRVSSAASVARLSGPTNAVTPESDDVPAVLPAASTTIAPIWDGTLSHPADVNTASRVRRSANGSGS